MCKRFIYLTSFMVMLVGVTGVTNGGSLWGYYPINENDFDDYSGNNHHGTPVDGAATVSDAQRGWVATFNDVPSKPSRVNCGTDDPSADGVLSVSAWVKWEGLNGNWQGMAGKSFQYGQRRWIFQLRDSDGFIQWGGSDADGLDVWSDVAPAIGDWQHVAGTSDGSYAKVFINGQLVGEGPSGFTPDSAVDANVTLGFGEDRDDYDESFNGAMDEIYIYSRALSDNQILDLSFGIAPSFNKADSPDPANGAFHNDTWASLSWTPGETAVSHDVYFGENLDDVKNGTGDTFRGNQGMAFSVVGFPGYPYPEGLVPGTTYYWRVDEIEADGVTKHEGNVWSFSIPGKSACNPDPADGAGFVGPDVTLQWTQGFGAKMHEVYLGDNFADVQAGAPDTYKGASGVATFNAGTLELEKVYYWRVDEFDGVETYQGDVWSFTTPGAVGNPQPANGAMDVRMNAILTWTPADSAASHELYFGADREAVRNADAGSPEYKGSKALGAESYDPGLLEPETAYYWRVDEVDNQGNLSKGPVWTFATGIFLLVDDFESYTDDDAAGQAIWQSWIDGFGVADNGAQVGYLMPSYAERQVVHGGSQSMPLTYENTAGVTNSEAALTLANTRDWTAGGVAELSLWLRGNVANAAEPLYVSACNSAGTPAVVAHDDPSAATVNTWRQWAIPLQAFADQGINLANVDKIAIGLGSKGGAAAGGTGTMFIDDIALYRSGEAADE